MMIMLYLMIVDTVCIVCGMVTACTACVADPRGMAYTKYLLMIPLVTAGILHLTSATLGVTSLTVTSRGADGAEIQTHMIMVVY